MKTGGTRHVAQGTWYMSGFKFQLPSCWCSTSTTQTAETVLRAETFVPEALGSDIKNFKSTEQSCHTSDLCVLASHNAKLAGKGPAARTFPHTVLFTHFFTEVRDCPFSSGGLSPRCDKSQGCILIATLSCEEEKLWCRLPVLINSLVLSFPPKCLSNAPQYTLDAMVFFSFQVKTLSRG